MGHDLAIVGMACRYPGARSPSELWENVLAQRRAFRCIPADEVRAVLAEVLARLGHEKPEPLQHLIPHTVVVGNAPLVDHFSDLRIEVFPVAFEPQVESHVVDTGALVADLFDRNPDISRKLTRRPLHAMTQPDALDVCGPVQHFVAGG